MKNKAISWSEQESAVENAKTHLPRLLKRYFREGRKLADERPSPEILHQFRLSTKHVRYTLESFQPIYNSSLNELIRSLKDTQDFLGKISDANTTAHWLKTQLPARDKTVQKLSKLLEKEARQKTRKFPHFWRDHLDIPGSLKQWEEYLERPGRQKTGAAELKAGRS